MAAMTSRHEKLIPLKPKDHYILYALLDEERYGYAIAQQIQKLSAGRVRVEAGNLHRHIQKLIRQGLVTPSESRPSPDADDERRRYYAITAAGRELWAADIRHMDSLVQAARKRASQPRARGA